MRKLFLLLSLVTFCSYAQVDTTSPYVWQEVEVVDTAKTVEMAHLIKVEREKANAEIKIKITLLQSLKESGRKKVSSEEDKIRLKEIAQNYGGQKPNNKGLIVGPSAYLVDLEKGKINKDFFNEFNYIQSELTKSMQTEDFNSIYATLFPVPKKRVKVKKENPNYGFRWFDKYDKSKLKYKYVSYPQKDDYYISDEYSQYKFRQHNYDSRRWSIYDRQDNLLAVAMPFDYYNEKDDIRGACNRYDFEHNAYNINADDAAVKNYVAAKFSGATAETEIFARQFAIRMLNTKLDQARQYLSRRQITQQEFNNISKAVGDEKGQYEKEIAEWQKKMPPANVMSKANNYIEQLDKDNANVVADDMSKSRIDGLNFILTSPKGRLRVQQTYYYDKKKKKVECKYKVLEK